METTAPSSMTTPMDGSLLVLSGITKSYFRHTVETPVLHEISLEIQQGAFLALMGPSGSGKTTLLNLMAGIDRPTQGSVHVAGTDLGRLSDAALGRWRARHIGFVFQFYHLIPVLTAFENVELPLLLTPLPRKERAQHVQSALTLVGLSDRTDHYPHQLSGGQEQRVGIARAIVSDPTLILADEPTGNLDKDSADAILALLQQLNTELHKTIVMVTHDPRAAERAHTIQHLDKGTLST